MWHSSHPGPSSTQAESLIRWLESKDLSLISEIDKPTHARGNLLDLCFGTCQLVATGTTAVAQQELEVTSDHAVLLASVACGPRDTSPPTALRFATIDKDNFLALLRMQLEGTALVEPCKEARSEYREKIRAGTASQTDRKGFRKVINNSKVAFFQKRVDEATNAKNVFDITKWHKSKGVFRCFPLKDPLASDSPPEQQVEGKMMIIARNLLTNHSDVEDISFNAPTVAHKALSFPEVTVPKVSNAFLEAGNTTPGKDQIPNVILRLAWPHISALVHDSFQACLDNGHHPRPIALLSVLGKGLERLVAKLMSWIAIKHKVLASQRFGALPQRSSVDLTTCLTHDVEMALAKGLTATMATLDIKGAFDAVLRGRLIKRLRKQGWPAQLYNWITSFVSNREVCIRLDGQTGKPIVTRCGLPQGSTVSPILFMLYNAPLFKLDGLKKASGYADDVAVLEVSPSLQENVTKLENAINQALAWGSSEIMTFDPS
ncbi:hypothetical protein K3495_g5429 [Podosphaera aphanis]|nr:hypothetical protein K3495_g5429 [Podosphaera aphanis]